MHSLAARTRGAGAAAAAAPRPHSRAISLRSAAPALQQQRRHAHAPPRQVLAAAALSNIKMVNEEELEVIVGSSIDKPTVIDFFATWCGPCLLLAQELEKVAKDLGDDVQILKLDVDQNPNMSTRLQIQGLPTMIFISTQPDKPALRTEGLLPAETIKNIISKEL